ncbi:MAG: phytanoyl-CoA dioxygenase family protein [Proteobacteria bacterium]|nr:phytanoyl-CoA dioxygenase family protein [Pseudomonadota bacterium]
MATWNADDLPRASRDPAVLVADLERWGYCLADGLLDRAALARTVAAVRATEARRAGPDAPTTYDGREGDQWLLLLAGEDGFEDLITNATALALVRHVLGQHVNLSGFSCHIVHPGNDVMGLHTDQWWLPPPVVPGAAAVRPGDITRGRQPYGAPEIATGPISPAVVVNVMWALSDFSENSGATRFVPGSHLSGHHPDPAIDWPTVSAELPAGGAVIWDARCWHASGANRGNGARMGITATFMGPQFRQQQNFPYALRPSAQAALSDELRSLLGFRVWNDYGASDDFAAEFARPGYARGD